MRYLSYFTLLLCVCVLVARDVRASDPAWFSCTSEGSVGDTGDNAAFSLGMLSDFDGKSYWILQGRLDVPTPAYSYVFTLTRHTARRQQAKLKLIPPSNMVGAVIDTLHLSERHEMKLPFDALVIDVDKTFHWGVQRILCDARL